MHFKRSEVLGGPDLSLNLIMLQHGVMLVLGNAANSCHCVSRRACQSETFDTMKRAGIQKPRKGPIRVKFREDRVVSLVGGHMRIETIPLKDVFRLRSPASAGNPT